MPPSILWKVLLILQVPVISPLWFVQLISPSHAQQSGLSPGGSFALFSVLPKPLLQTSTPASVTLYSRSLTFLINRDLFSFLIPSAFFCRNHLDCRRPQFYSWVGKILWSKDRLPTPVFLGFPNDSDSKKNPPAGQETWVQSLGWEDLWRRVRQPTLVFLPGESAWTEEPRGLQPIGSWGVGHDWATKHVWTNFLTFTHWII